MKPDAVAALATDVLFVVLPGVLLLDLAGPAEALRLANDRSAAAGRPRPFRLRWAGARAGEQSSVGLGIGPLEPLPGSLPPGAWVVLAGQPDASRARGPEWHRTRAWLREVVAPALARPRQAARLVAICSGSLLAADAGLLAGRSCTTHHQLLGELRRLAPRARVVENRVFVHDGPVSTSAGITAGIDLALHLVEQVAGPPVAAAVAETMVVYARRGPGDPEHSPLLAHRSHIHPAVHRVQDAVCREPGRAWTVVEMARAGRVTGRHLGRLFARHAGVSPLAYLQRIRLARASESLAVGASVTEAAEVAGFGSDKALRRAWRRHRAGTPRDLRRGAAGRAAAGEARAASR